MLPNLGNFFRTVNTLKRIKETKKIDILALGGSITAGGYFEEFARLLREKTNSEVIVRNHGHGATEITCKIIILLILKFIKSNLFYIFFLFK